MAKRVPKKDRILIVVLFERLFSETHASEIGRIIRELRGLAMQQPGYVASQTLLSDNDCESFLMTSTWETWKSLEHWQAWCNHPDRQELEAELSGLQKRPAAVQVVT
jgi:heme-degrading monooxygenase HmoA